MTRRDLSHRWNLTLAEHDLVISPTLNVLPWAVGQNLPPLPDGEPNYGWAATAVFNLTRHPAITVPCGLSASGLPIGLQIIAGHYRDATLLAAASAYLEAEPFPFPVLPA